MELFVPERAQVVLEFIRRRESNGNYLAYFGHAHNLNPLPGTLSALLLFQTNMVRLNRFPSTAVGAYQFLQRTVQRLMTAHKLAGTTPFTPQLQDWLAHRLLVERGYDDWCASRISADRFADNLSEEWASMPYHTGRSFYSSDGLNKSLVSRPEFMACLAQAARTPNSIPQAPVVGTPVAGTPVVADTSGRPPAKATPTKTASKDLHMNPISGMLASVKIASTALPVIFGAVSNVEQHLPDIKTKFLDLEQRLIGAWTNAKSLDLNSAEQELGAAWSDGMGIFADVGLPRELVQGVVETAAQDTRTEGFVGAAEGIVGKLLANFGLAAA